MNKKNKNKPSIRDKYKLKLDKYINKPIFKMFALKNLIK